jgi:hypothetical protein
VPSSGKQNSPPRLFSSFPPIVPFFPLMVVLDLLADLYQDLLVGFHQLGLLVLANRHNRKDQEQQQDSKTFFS